MVRALQSDVCDKLLGHKVTHLHCSVFMNMHNYEHFKQRPHDRVALIDTPENSCYDPNPSTCTKKVKIQQTVAPQDGFP